jgi:hypothetical protein
MNEYQQCDEFDRRGECCDEAARRIRHYADVLREQRDKQPTLQSESKLCLALLDLIDIAEKIEQGRRP